MKKTLDQWLKDGSYLPKFMRDFHAQKGIFKWMWKKTDVSSNNYLADLSWVGGHVLVIDYFLWFMAKHGYTLQPAKKDFEFRDWSETIDQMEREEADAFRKMLEERKP